MFGFGKKKKGVNAKDVPVNEITKSIAARFDCKYTLYQKGSKAKSLEKDYLELLESSQGQSFVPVILVCDEYVDEWFGIIEEDNIVREELIAVCKYWYESYGAFPALFTHDVLEFYVPNKIDASKKMDLAKEHYAFCTDRVEQSGDGVISALAAGLPKSTVWFFWWD